jgi:DNA-binding XRE family transcriptional regulator
MTLFEYRERALMSIPELARRANIDAQSVKNAEDGKRVQPRIARAIAAALSEALGETITPQDIDGLSIRL